MPVRAAHQEASHMKRFYTPAVLTTIVVVVSVLGAPIKWY
jgi:hypothetical protein